MPIADQNESVWHSVSTGISACTEQSFTVERIRPVTGGCINTTVIIDNGSTSYFVKLNSAEHRKMFEAEAEGLRELSRTDTLRVPMPVCCGEGSSQAWLVLENMGEMVSGTKGGWNRLGRGLALMHRCRHDKYGWHRDNTIGSSPQINTRSQNWVEFLRDCRIGYQLALADRNGHGDRLQPRGSKLLDKFEFFFADYIPEASLLHGDLWSGNVGFVDGRDPVIFDPAVYYGDREADVAMTELFGSFAPEFYDAYQTEWPLDKGYEVRKQLYNLYHLLNHLNLFGRGYLANCESTIDRLLSEVC